MKITLFIRAVFFLLVALYSTLSLAADPLPRDKVPEPLQPWIDWALHDHPDHPCPFLFNRDLRWCVWPGTLDLRVNDTGAQFTQTLRLYRDGYFHLPGDSRHWPVEVRADGEPVVVLETRNRPAGYLPAGSYRVEGRFHWQQIPRTLTLPNGIGQVVLTVGGEPVRNLRMEDQNQLVLSDAQAESVDIPADSLNLRVYRLLHDTLPLENITELQLDVSGRERELVLGRILLENFIPLSLDSALPARLEPDGSIRVQLRPGRWQLRLHSYTLGPVSALAPTTSGEHWPDHEVWAFRSDEHNRSVELRGAQRMDPSQTAMPQEWHQYPAFYLPAGTSLKIDELHRAPTHFGDHQLRLHKRLWLNFAGTGFIARDTISGTFKGHTRLEVQMPYELGSATARQRSQEAQPLLVTQLDSSDRPGIEVRIPEGEVVALSRLPRRFTIPVAGWHQEFRSVSTDLHLPPGWALLGVLGAEYTHNTWLGQWRLWDVFLVLLISVVIGRSASLPLGVLALVTLVLTFHRAELLVFFWLNLAVCLALAAFIADRWKAPLRTYATVGFVLLAVFYMPFAGQQAKLALFPQLERAGVVDREYSDGILEEIGRPSPMDRVRDSAAMMVEEVVVTGMRPSLSVPMGEPYPPRPAAKAVPLPESYGPGQELQAGPAEPGWHWRNSQLRWRTPVSAEQNVTLLLVPPLFTRLGHLLALLLPLGLALGLWRALQLRPIRLGRTPGGNSGLILLLAALPLLPAEPAGAEVLIDPDILETLEKRLTRAADCLPSCAAIENVTLQVAGDRLNISLRIHAKEQVAVPLPSGANQWQPDRVTLNGQPTVHSRDAGGQSHAALPPGTHSLNLQASLAGLQQADIHFGMNLHNLNSTVDGWTLSGAPRAQVSSQDLRLERTPGPDAGMEELLQPAEMPAFVQVTRTLKLQSDWVVETWVERRAPARGAINITIPLLANETPLSGEVTENAEMRVSLSPNQNHYQWTSVLRPTSLVVLTAPTGDLPWVERWHIEAGPMWHLDTEGSATLAQGDSVAQWRARPGDELRVHVARPQGISGETLTLTYVRLDQRNDPGGHTTSLAMNIKTYQGGHFPFTLPDDVELTSLHVNNSRQSVNRTQRDLRLPLTPGENALLIEWRSTAPQGLVARTPALDLGQPAGNVSVTLMMPEVRWILLTGGPALGPVVLMWGLLLLVLGVTLAAARLGLQPLTRRDWILLSFGTIAAGWLLPAVVLVALAALTLRGSSGPERLRRWFKPVQTVLLLLTVLLLAVLATSVAWGLLEAPRMMIAGNVSNHQVLNWYDDQIAGELPVGWVLSLPLWVYRTLMLLWSLWLVFSLVRWLPWIWRQLGANGWWRVPKVKPSPEAATP